MILELIQWVVTTLKGPPIIEMVGPWVQYACSLLGELPII